MSANVVKRRGLFGGLFFLYVGLVFLLVKLGYIDNAWDFLGNYWPLLLILAGVAKTAEYFTLGGGKLFRIGELFLVLLIVLAGVSIHSAAPFLNSLAQRIEWDRGHFSLDTFYRDSFQFQEEKTLSLQPGGILTVQNGRGNVVLIPSADGQSRLRIQKQIYAQNQTEAGQIAEKIQAQISQQGNRTNIVLEQIRDTNTHLEILSPPQISLRVETGNGEISAEGFQGASHSFRTHHEKIRLAKLSGDVAANNQYGEIVAAEIKGSAQLSSVHGNIQARNISGDLTITDSNAPVEIADIQGKVKVANSHNSVQVLRAGGLVDISAPQSAVIVEDAQGPVIVEAGQREVRLTRIAGSAEVRQKHGTVTLERIGAEVKATLEYTEFNGFDLHGPIRLEGVSSGIRLEKTTGDIDIRNSMRPISLIDFQGRVQVDNENGSVILSSAAPLRQAVQVRTHHGSIELLQPENAGFQIVADTKNGRLHSDFTQIPPPPSERRPKALNGQIGVGGPTVTLESIQGNISIKKRN